MSKVIIRDASLNDVETMLEIYGPYVTTTTVTSEYEIPSYQEFKYRLVTYTMKTPWLVCEIDGKAVGYGYAAPHRSRASYQWSVETSIYVHMDYQRLGIARAIYTALIEILKLQGYYNIFVGITYPNRKSLKFHESMGFRISGRYKNSMYKFGKWRDVTWMGLELQPCITEPERTIDSHKLQSTTDYQEILQRAAEIVKIERLQDREHSHFEPEE